MSAWPPLPPLSPGEFAPRFAAVTRDNPKFHFSTLPGRYLLLGFMPTDPARRDAALAAAEPWVRDFDDHDRTSFLVSPLPEAETPPDRIPGRRWFFDPQGEVARLYGARDEDGTERPFWLLLDPMLRIMARAPLEAPEPVFSLLERLPPAAEQAGVPLVAPVLIAPRIFEPAFCRQLIAYYQAQGGQPSGVMRDIGGKTVAVLDHMKRRRDVMVADETLRQGVIHRLNRRLLPFIARALQFEATRLERHLVACYDAGEGGYFKAHRDNETFGTAHRRFAVSINLNAEDFEGGDLRFPEFGPKTYRPPTGGAVVFCCSLQHEATPVTKGRRYAFLPFLYDEEGERIRAQNAEFLDQGPPLVLDR